MKSIGKTLKLNFADSEFMEMTGHRLLQTKGTNKERRSGRERCRHLMHNIFAWKQNCWLEKEKWTDGYESLEKP
jgi:hypothetical protein